MNLCANCGNTATTGKFQCKNCPFWIGKETISFHICSKACHKSTWKAHKAYHNKSPIDPESDFFSIFQKVKNNTGESLVPAELQAFMNRLRTNDEFKKEDNDFLGDGIESKQLHPDGSDVNTETIVQLAKALQSNTHVTDVSLADQDLDDRAAISFAELLRTNNNDNNQKITSLILTMNCFTDIGAKAIAKSLEFNDTLTNLMIHGNEFGSSGAQAFLDAMKYNSALTDVSIRSEICMAVSQDAMIPHSIHNDILNLCKQNEAGMRTRQVQINKAERDRLVVVSSS
jgi:hypothetical protein